MVPHTIVKLEHVPLSPNGKIDRDRLPAPDMDAQQASEHVKPVSLEQTSVRDALLAPSQGVRSVHAAGSASWEDDARAGKARAHRNQRKTRAPILA